MNNLLKPERLAVDPNSPTAAKEWRFWHQTFKNFLTLCGNDAPDKYLTIINLRSHSVYDYVEDCTDYNSVVAILEKLYVKTPNEIFARHLLATRGQQSGESLDEFLLELRKLSKDCNLKAVSVEQYKEELVRDSFINGLSSPLTLSDPGYFRQLTIRGGALKAPPPLRSRKLLCHSLPYHTCEFDQVFLA